MHFPDTLTSLQVNMFLNVFLTSCYLSKGKRNIKPGVLGIQSF